MKVRKFKRSAIIDHDWNMFIERTTQDIIYGKTWYLDAIPQEWGALFAFENEELIGVLPYQITRKYGIIKIQQDPFVNELGVFHLKDRSECIQPLLNRLFAKKFISIYRFNANNYPLPDQHRTSYEITHHLKLNTETQKIRLGYSKNLTRNIQKARKNSIKILVCNEIEDLISLFKLNVAEKISGIEEYQYDILRTLYKALSKKGLTKIYQTYSASNSLLSAALIVRSNRRLIYFFAASTEEGKKLNAQALLIDQLIEEYSGSELILDFEGGDTPGLKRFYSSFGATELKIPIHRKMLGEDLYQKLTKKLFNHRQ